MKNIFALTVILIAGIFIIYGSSEIYKKECVSDSVVQTDLNDVGNIASMADYYFHIGLDYGHGWSDKELNHDIAADWYLKASGLGDHRAQYNLGHYYLQNKGDTQSAVYWLQMSLNNGDPAAGYLLGAIHNIKFNNFDVASDIWKKASQLGSFESKVHLAQEYEKRGNFEDAKLWYQKITEIPFEKHVELDRHLRFTPESYVERMRKEYQNSVDYLSVLDGDTGNIDEMLSDFE